MMDESLRRILHIDAAHEIYSSKFSDLWLKNALNYASLKNGGRVYCLPRNEYTPDDSGEYSRP